MEQNDKLVLVYATFPDLAMAESVAGILVRDRLAACVNLLPGMISVYEWQGQLERGGEIVAIIKTRAVLADAVVAAVRSQHSYDNPAILVLPVTGGSAQFAAWIAEQTDAVRHS
jgi:periplasmic divalent cation tolerance protein